MASLKDIKLASFTWDSDKSPNGFTKFMENWSSIVRAVHGGDELECFLDRKLGRSRSSKALVPTFISQDPRESVCVSVTDDCINHVCMSA